MRARCGGVFSLGRPTGAGSREWPDGVEDDVGKVPRRVAFERAKARRRQSELAGREVAAVLVMSTSTTPLKIQETRTLRHRDDSRERSCNWPLCRSCILRGRVWVTH
jgi:hypothetical protein